MLLSEYITKHFNGNKAAYGRHMGVEKDMVYRWVRTGYIVFEGRQYSPNRKVKELEK